MQRERNDQLCCGEGREAEDRVIGVRVGDDAVAVIVVLLSIVPVYSPTTPKLTAPTTSPTAKSPLPPPNASFSSCAPAALRVS